MPYKPAYEIIAEQLKQLGLDAWTQGGWVYVSISPTETMCIFAEFGQSLDVQIGPYTRPAERAKPAKPEGWADVDNPDRLK